MYNSRNTNSSDNLRIDKPVHPTVQAEVAEKSMQRIASEAAARNGRVAIPEYNQPSDSHCVASPPEDSVASPSVGGTAPQFDEVVLLGPVNTAT